MSEKTLRELEEESRRWQEENRGKGFYDHEKPGHLEEHNRQVEIARRRRAQNPPENDSWGDDWDGIFPGIRRPRFF